MTKDQTNDLQKDNKKSSIEAPASSIATRNPSPNIIRVLSEILGNFSAIEE